MYTIIKMMDGNYRCEGQLQDETMIWTTPNFNDAVVSMITFAKTMNNTAIKKKDITLCIVEQVVRERIVPVDHF
jgi:hypothetical protein